MYYYAEPVEGGVAEKAIHVKFCWKDVQYVALNKGDPVCVNDAAPNLAWFASCPVDVGLSA